MKKFFCILTTLMFIFMSISSVSAASAQEEVDRSVFDRLQELQKSGQIKDEDIAEFLKEEGWTLSDTETVSFDRYGKVIPEDPSGVSTRSVDPMYYTVTISTTYNDRVRDEWTIVTNVEKSSSEWYPASFDLFSVDWEGALFSYRSHKADSVYKWLSNASQANNGSLFFSMRDLFSNGDISNWVGVKQKAWGAKNTSFSINFCHTYDKTNTSTTQGGEASLEIGGKLSLGVNWSVTKTTVEDNWKKAAIVALTTN